MHWLLLSALNTWNVRFIHTEKLEGALVQKRPMCITEVIELMTLQEISNMDKGIQLSLWLNKKKI